MFGFGKKKAQIKEFINDETKAIVRIYADKVMIDGKKTDEFEMIKGEYGELIVKLAQGDHQIKGIHRTSNLSTNFKTGVIESKIHFEANHEYTFGIYEYSQEYLEANKDDPRMRYVYYLPMEAKGKKFGIICFVNR